MSALKSVWVAGCVSAAALLSSAASAADISYDHEGSLKDTPMPYGLIWGGTLDLWIAGVGIESNLGAGDGDDPDDTARLGGTGRVNIPLSRHFSAQLDVDSEFDTASEDDDGTGDYDGLVQIGGHLSYRDAGYLVGVFGGYGMVATHDDDDERGYLVGAEGQLRYGNWVGYLQGGYYDVPDAGDDETMRDAFFVRGEKRYFFTPNDMLSASLLYGEGEEGGTVKDDITFAGWNLEFRQKFDDKPLAWFVAYDGHYVEIDKVSSNDDEDLTEHVFKVGLSFVMNAVTLQENDAFGATLSTPTDPLKASGYTVDIVD